MSKKILSVSEDYDFGLIGISSHVKDYRLCWELNQLLTFDLVKTEDIVNRQRSEASFTHYCFEDDENHIRFHLIGNKSAEGVFSTEFREVDYFLLIIGDHHSENVTDLLPQIIRAGTVLTAFEIDVNSLKSKDLFILE